jgi:hypothetical protein
MNAVQRFRLISLLIPEFERAAIKRADWDDGGGFLGGAALDSVPVLGTARQFSRAIGDFGEGRIFSGLGNIAGGALSMFGAGPEVAAGKGLLRFGGKALGLGGKALGWGAKGVQGARAAGGLAAKLPWTAATAQHAMGVPGSVLSHVGRRLESVGAEALPGQVNRFEKTMPFLHGGLSATPLKNKPWVQGIAKNRGPLDLAHFGYSAGTGLLEGPGAAAESAAQGTQMGEAIRNWTSRPMGGNPIWMDPPG